MKIYGNENNSFILKEIGKRIHDLRVRQSITQADLARLAGVSLRTIGRLENGEGAALENLLNILRVLKMLPNIDMLITEQELSPTDYIDYGKQRIRVSQKTKTTDNVEWKWGEDL